MAALAARWHTFTAVIPLENDHADQGASIDLGSFFPKCGYFNTVNISFRMIDIA